MEREGYNTLTTEQKNITPKFEFELGKAAMVASEATGGEQANEKFEEFFTLKGITAEFDGNERLAIKISLTVLKNKMVKSGMESLLLKPFLSPEDAERVRNLIKKYEIPNNYETLGYFIEKMGSDVLDIDQIKKELAAIMGEDERIIIGRKAFYSLSSEEKIKAVILKLEARFSSMTFGEILEYHNIIVEDPLLRNEIRLKVRKKFGDFADKSGWYRYPEDMIVEIGEFVIKCKKEAALGYTSLVSLIKEFDIKPGTYPYYKIKEAVQEASPNIDIKKISKEDAEIIRKGIDFYFEEQNEPSRCGWKMELFLKDNLGDDKGRVT